ncbi:MAG: hypothetical protein KIT10_14430 [Flavobacteriales bacterium]|nr:hypothetical protein [Flavobacteriales bacterium]
MAEQENNLKFAVASVLDSFDDQLLKLKGPKALEQLTEAVMEKLIERVATSTENADMTPGQRSAAVQLMGKVMQEDKNCDAVVLVRVLADGRVATGGASRNWRDGALQELGAVCRMAITNVVNAQRASCRCEKCQAERAAMRNVFNGPKAEA